MATFKAAKVVAALPGTLEPNTAYFLRAGAGFDLYCSDSTGTIAHKLNVPEELNLISQAEAEAGVATTLRAWTSQRVRQAIAGWWAGVTLTKAMVGLSAADNTADSAKNVLSATKLTTPRTINGVSFDGTANITINAVDSTARLAASEKGAADGVVPLVNSLIPAQYLPTLGDLGGQAALVSGTNIKTVNGNSLLGSGNLVISGGASPGGSDRQIQYKDGTGLGGASSAWIDGSGELVLGAVEDPPAPDTAGLLLFGRQVTSRYLPGFVGPKGLTTVVQPHISRNFVGSVRAQGNGTVLSSTGLTLTAVGTATAANVATTNIHTQSKRIGYHVTTAATSAIAGCRGAATQFFTGTPGSRLGGFHFLCRFGPSLSSAAMTNKRIFCGLYASTSAPTDTNPSGLSNIIGVGCDSGDANFQLMTRAASGSATKVNTGISKTTTVATEVYEVGVFAPPDASTVYIELRRLSDGLTFGQEISTTLPSATTLLNTYLWMSAGGTSSTVGVALLNMYIETDT